MTIRNRDFQQLLSAWLEAKDETDRLLGKYIAVERSDLSDSSVPMPESELDIEGVRLIALAKRKEEACKEAFLEAARKETGKVK